MSKIKQILDKLNSELDLNKQLDYYFDKWIFRGAFLILIFLFCFLILSDGLQQKVYLNCPVDVGSCKNPLYKNCNDLLESYQENFSHYSIKQALSYCEQEYLFPGTTIGEPPNWIYKNFWFFSIGILLIAFVVNHFVHNKNKELII